MKTKQMEFLQLLDSYVSEYMPVIAGMSENTIRLYKATFRLLFEFLYETKENALWRHAMCVFAHCAPLPPMPKTEILTRRSSFGTA